MDPKQVHFVIKSRPHCPHPEWWALGRNKHNNHVVNLGSFTDWETIMGNRAKNKQLKDIKQFITQVFIQWYFFLAVRDYIEKSRTHKCRLGTNWSVRKSYFKQWRYMKTRYRTRIRKLKPFTDEHAQVAAYFVQVVRQVIAQVVTLTRSELWW